MCEGYRDGEAQGPRGDRHLQKENQGVWNELVQGLQTQEAEGGDPLDPTGKVGSLPTLLALLLLLFLRTVGR